MTARASLLVFALGLRVALPGVARADEGPRPADDPIGARLFPPELIMSRQQELGIDDAQRAAILKEMERLQAQVLPQKWQLQAAVEQLTRLLEPARVDEAKALAQADKVMGMEREIKKAHLLALVRIKNLLTDAQRARLAEVRRERTAP